MTGASWWESFLGWVFVVDEQDNEWQRKDTSSPASQRNLKYVKYPTFILKFEILPTPAGNLKYFTCRIIFEEVLFQNPTLSVQVCQCLAWKSVKRFAWCIEVYTWMLTRNLRYIMLNIIYLCGEISEVKPLMPGYFRIRIFTHMTLMPHSQ